jgi:predicted dehydrogenase
MPESVRVGIIGAGWPGSAHARGYLNTPGFKLLAIADLIPDRRKKLMAEFQIPREYGDAKDLLADKEIDAVSICLPNDLHAPIAAAALKSGKHVLCEKPPAPTLAQAKRMDAAAAKSGKVLLYALQRRFGGHEQAAKLAIAKGFIGEPYHVRAAWTRTRGIPQGTGWYTQKEKSGGGALIDVGLPMLDIAWHLLGQPKPLSACAVTHSRLANVEVDDTAFAILRFENNKSLELACSWAINQPPQQNGHVCRIHGTTGAIEVYTPKGATLYHHFTPKGEHKENPLKPPKLVHHSALIRHFKDCISGKSTPSPGGPEGITLMQMIDSLYRSAATGRSVTM